MIEGRFFNKLKKNYILANNWLLEINKIVIDFKSYCNSEVIRALQYGDKDRYIDQWNGIENLEINLYGPRIFNVGVTQYIGGKDRLYKKWLFNNWICLFRKIWSKKKIKP